MTKESGRFAGRVALITGAASGIGRATAVAFAKEGATVVMLDIQRELLEVAARQIANEGGKTIAVHGDVRNAADCQAAVDAAVQGAGGLDTVFCNAGVFEPGTAETQSIDDFVWQVDVMLKGTYLTCRAAVPALRARGGGSIILNGSNCSHIGCPGRIGYSAAKGAMPVLAKQLSNDYYHSAKIRANVVSPGYVKTGMTEAIWRRQTGASATAEVPESLTSTWQKAEVIASAVMWLASDESAEITGVSVPVSRTAILRVVGMR